MRYSYDMRNDKIWREVEKKKLKTGSKQQRDTKERIKSLLAPKPTAGQPPVSSYRAPAR
jgi:hypothetical protein